MAGRVAGKVALISGAARGQGASHAKRLVAEGASVVIGDLRDEEGEETAASIRAEGGAARYLHLDVTSAEDWAAAVATAEEEYGELTVLINNAGIMSLSDAESCSDEEWNRTIAVNQTGVFFGMRAAVPAMRRAGGGSIINISSAVVNIGSPGIFAYQTSKAAVVAMTKAAAASYGDANIRVNAIAPGLIYTPMIDDLVNDLEGYDPDRDELPLQVLNMKATGENISTTVVYLASDESAYHTGDLLTVDGGMSIGGLFSEG